MNMHSSKEREVHTHLVKTRNYLESVASYMKEQPKDKEIHVRLGIIQTKVSAGELANALEEIDADVQALLLMSEQALEDEVISDDNDTPPQLNKIDFLITDNDRYRASGKFMTSIVNLLRGKI